MRKKITFFLPSLECGGAERNTINLLKSLSGERYSLSLFLAEKKGDFIKDVPKDVSIIALNVHNMFRIFFHLLAYFKANKTDIFISAFPRFNAVALLAKKFSGGSAKLIITEHLSFFLLSKNAKTVSHRFIARFIFPYFIKFFYAEADVIVCVSQGVADEISAMMGGDPPSDKLSARHGKIRVIYNPISDDTILKMAEEEVGHPWFSSDANIPIIVMVGRLSKTKDQPTLFKAFNLILKKRRAHLVLVGDGTQKNALISLADQLNISKDVAFLGFQDNPYKYMSKASVFVLSSLQEGFGNVIVEAMVCGAPVVATDCKSGPSEIIQDNNNGLLVPPQDEKALADAILRILNDHSLAKKFSIEGKKRAEFFSVKKSVGEYEELFYSLVNGKNDQYF